MAKRAFCGALCLVAVLALELSGGKAAEMTVRPDGKPADMTKKVKVFILLGQSNMVGLGKIKGGEGSLENAVREKKKYPYLVDEAGNWVERKDVRFVRCMQGRGLLNNEWLTVAKCKTIGPEFGLAPFVGDAIDAPVMILKSCIGNRSLGWDLLPPGSERYQAEVTLRGGQKVTKVFAGYKDRPDSWVMDPSKGTATDPPPWLDRNGKPINWYAGKQYDDDTADAKKVLAELDKHYPGAKGYEVAGFFFWQGEKDCGNAVHAARYEQNLVRFIKQLRKDFNAPDAKFVLATLGESTKGSGGNGGMVLNAQLAVDGSSGKYPEFKGNVATVYSHPMAQGGSGNGHYGGKAEVYMDVGEAMGRAMVELLPRPAKAEQGGNQKKKSVVDKQTDAVIAPVEDVAFFEKKYQKRINGVKPIGEYSDPDQFYSAIATQLGIPDVAWAAAAAKYGWKKDDGKVTRMMVKGGPTAGGGQGKWDVMFFRFAVNPATKKPDPATIETKIVQIDYEGGIKFFNGK
jgi:hypothetical protein